MRPIKIVLLAILTLFGCYAETPEQALLRHVIDAAPNGFVNLRGKPYRQVSNMWESVTIPVGAETCMVNWTGTGTNPVELDCLMLMASTKAEADREFLRLRDVIASVVPGWKDARQAPPAEDNFRMFFEPYPEGSAVRRTIVVRYDQQKSGQYHVEVQFHAAISPATARETAEKNRRDIAEFVAADVKEFLAAAVQGFESYKKGDAKTTPDGIRWWDSSRNPILVEHCEIQQRGQANNFVCVFTRSAYKGELELQYEQLVSDVIPALPPNWMVSDQAPFNGVIASKGFVASDKMSGQIWIALDASTNEYSLNYQIVGKAR